MNHVRPNDHVDPAVVLRNSLRVRMVAFYSNNKATWHFQEELFGTDCCPHRPAAVSYAEHR